MKKCFFKNYKNLILYKKCELNNLIIKILYFKKLKNKNKNYAKIFCFETGVKRSVYSSFNLSRWNLKKNLLESKVCGLKKISW